MPSLGSALYAGTIANANSGRTTTGGAVSQQIRPYLSDLGTDKTQLFLPSYHDIHVVSANVEDPWLGLMKGHHLRTTFQQRADKIADILSGTDAKVLLLQESFPEIERSLLERGFQLIKANEKIPDQEKWWQRFLKGTPGRTLLCIALTKDYRIVNYGFESFSNQGNFQNSLSGSLRKDGRLWVEVELHKNTKIRFENVHLESFNSVINEKQQKEIALAIENTFAQTKGKTVLFIGGDFNYERDQLSSDLTKQVKVLNQSTGPSFQSHYIDAILTADKSVVEVEDRLLSSEYHSDHNFIEVKCRIKESSGSLFGICSVMGNALSQRLKRMWEALNEVLKNT